VPLPAGFLQRRLQAAFAGHPEYTAPVVDTTRHQQLLETNEKFELAHPTARAAFPAEGHFVWNGADDLAPFGSDAGYTALQEFLEWRLRNRESPLGDCMTWVIESVGEMEVSAYNTDLVDRTTLTNQIENEEFDDRQFVWTLDVTVIATAFGQFITEGVIDRDARPALEIALRRQLLHADILRNEWPHASTYEANLNELRPRSGQLLEHAERSGTRGHRW